ncbi:hypothetical protein C2E23DRAFT_773187 [Lenzites betulinus]|nr:hypothetical protein C2E23DRAFT_773187 [Lenzites betulinus]
MVTDSRYVLDGLTRHARAWENCGWIGIANAALLQRVLAAMRARSAPTSLRWVRGHTGVPGNEAADALARKGALQPPSFGPQERPRDEFLLSGVALPTLTQSLAYRGIKARTSAPERPATAANMATILHDLRVECGGAWTSGDVWEGLSAKPIRKQVRDFLWKAIHGAHRVGKYWANIPAYEARELCPWCGVREDLEHILLACDAPGRKLVWTLSVAALRRKGIEVRHDKAGIVLAPHMYTVRAANGTPHHARTRVARIILSEATYLIWALRCERVIGWADEPDRRHTAREIANKWQWTLTRRLRMDQAMARRASPKRRPACIAMVERTWGGLVRNAEELPPDWMLCTGVLVGIPANEARLRD